MPTYKITDLDRLASAGQGDRTGSSRNQNSAETYQLPPLVPVSIRERIYDVMARGGDRYWSRADIARALELKKSPWLCDHIEQLVIDGYLVKQTSQYKTGALMWLYEVRRE